MNSSVSKRRQWILQEASEWLIRVQDEACTEAELEAWEQWLQTSPEHAAAFDDVSELWEASSKLDSAAVLSARKKQAAVPDRSAADERRAPRWSLRFVAGLAASVLIVAVAFFLSMNREQGDDVLRLVTNVGERRHVVLEDGSTVDLDAATEVRVRYGENRRDIELRAGQAFFSVAHSPERPFIVAAGKVESRALGTRFVVSHRASHDVNVTVVEGRVRVSETAERGRAASAVEATAGEQVTFSDQTGLQAPRDVNAGFTTAWREGVVIYQGESLENVIADLNRYSRVPVRLQDPALGRLKVTGRWELSAIDHWVDGLARASGTQIMRTADEIVLTRDDTQNSREVSPPAPRDGRN